VNKYFNSQARTENYVMMKSYKDLDIYNLAFQYSFEVHYASLIMPKFELYEQGSQVRRSSKSVKDNIIERYGRRK
jgi:hypothetical protein